MQDNINANEQSAAGTLPNTQNPPQTNKKKDPQKLFPLRYAKYASFYLLVVISSIIALGVGIYIAVTEDLLWGTLILFSAGFIYVYFSSSELHEKLGIWYKTESGSLSVTKCRARYGNVFYIPSRLLWYDVEELCDNAFFSPANKNSELETIFLPKTIKHIGKDAFLSCESLNTICYEGTEEEWSQIYNETDISGIEIVFGAVIPSKKSDKKKK